jgi:hypothetical protein
LPVVSIACGTRLLSGYYVMGAMAKLWEERGITVKTGRAFAPDADAHVLHLDRTLIADADLPAPPPGGRKVINWDVRDISKRRFSTLRVLPGDDWDGPVIVKSNLNHYGKPEAAARTETPQARNRRRMAEISWRSARQLPSQHYPVVPSLRRVPGWVWEDEDLVVEKFLPERDGDLFCLRGWMFLGSCSYGWRIRATDPQVRAGTRVDHIYLDEPPDEVAALRARYGFDFGKFDYAVHDGRAVVFDLNKTPAFVGRGDSPRLMHLSRGIEDYL